MKHFTTGTILHDLLSDKLGVDAMEGCRCKEWIDKMNVWGPVGSRKYLTKIVNALLAEAKRRQWKLSGHPILTKAAQIGTDLPGGMIFARAWVRRIVLQAITRSEQSEESKVDVRRDDRTRANP